MCFGFKVCIVWGWDEVVGNQVADKGGIVWGWDEVVGNSSCWFEVEMKLFELLVSNWYMY